MFGKYFLFDLNQYNKAIEFFTLNTTNYPSSSRAFEYLAMANKEAGNTAEAIVSYKKALELAPDNKEVQKTLTELEGQ